MTVLRPLALDGVFEIVPRKFGDDRGFFSETWNEALLAGQGIHLSFVQDNHSFSASKGVLRGLHYQVPPFAQAKLVRVVRGAVLDVAVDIRRSSPTFGRWISLEVSAAKWNQILVPAGFAHGFVTTEPATEVIYKVTAPYSPEHDRTIRFDDPDLAVEWPFPAATLTLSAKDAGAPRLGQAELFE